MSMLLTYSDDGVRYLIAFILIWNLNRNVLLIPWNIDIKGTLRYLQSGDVWTLTCSKMEGLFQKKKSLNLMQLLWK